MADKRELFSHSIKTFQFLRLWTKEGRKSLKTRVCQILVILCLSFTLVILLTETLEQHKRGRMELTFISALYTVAIAVCMHKLVNITLVHDEIARCINELQLITSDFKYTSKMDRSMNLYRKMYIIGTVISCLSCGLFVMSPLLSGEYRGLPFTPYLSFLDNQETPTWHLLYIYEIVAIFIFPGSAVAYDTLFCGIIGFSSSVIGCICLDIRELDNFIEDSQVLNGRMRITIDRLNKTTQITQRLSDVFSTTTMSHMIYNCNTLALALYMVTLLPLSDFNCMTMIIVINLLIFQLWIYCYFGQSLVDQREDLQTELYCTRWYEASKDFKTMLILMIFESQRDRYIYAWKIMPLSLQTLSEVLKKAYAIFTFLTNTTIER